RDLHAGLTSNNDNQTEVVVELENQEEIDRII
ncbi:unnamed protein product, partial [Rotaria sp. Silwood1]